MRLSIMFCVFHVFALVAGCGTDRAADPGDAGAADLLAREATAQDNSSVADLADHELGGDGPQPTETGAAKNPIVWKTPRVTLWADDFYVLADGKKFLGAQNVSLDSDPGDENYTTLEAVWIEHGVEMRLFIYFQSNGVTWSSDELRTYNGAVSPEWITYNGVFFPASVGAAYQGTVQLVSNPGVDEVHLDNVTIRAFL